MESARPLTAHTRRPRSRCTPLCPPCVRVQCLRCRKWRPRVSQARHHRPRRGTAGVEPLANAGHLGANVDAPPPPVPGPPWRWGATVRPTGPNGGQERSKSKTSTDRIVPMVNPVQPRQKAIVPLSWSTRGCGPPALESMCACAGLVKVHAPASTVGPAALTLPGQTLW